MKHKQFKELDLAILKAKGQIELRAQLYKVKEELVRKDIDKHFKNSQVQDFTKKLLIDAVVYGDTSLDAQEVFTLLNSVKKNK
jgi:hypothetical protein